MRYLFVLYLRSIFPFRILSFFFYVLICQHSRSSSSDLSVSPFFLFGMKDPQQGFVHHYFPYRFLIHNSFLQGYHMKPGGMKRRKITIYFILFVIPVYFFFFLLFFSFFGRGVFESTRLKNSGVYPTHD